MSTQKPRPADDPGAYHANLSGDLREEWRLVRRLESALDTAACLASDHADALRRWADAERRLDGVDDDGWRRLQALERIATLIRETCPELDTPDDAPAEEEPERLVRALLSKLEDVELELAELRQTPTPAPIADRVAVLREAYRVADAAAVESQVRQLDGHATMGLMLDRLHQLAWPLSYRPADPPPPTDPA